MPATMPTTFNIIGPVKPLNPLSPPGAFHQVPTTGTSLVNLPSTALVTKPKPNLPKQVIRLVSPVFSALKQVADIGLKLTDRDTLPLSAIVYLTYGCNFKCPHCTFPMIHGGKQLVSAQQWISVLEEMPPLGISHLHLMGGEPAMLRGSSGKMDGLVEVASAAKKLGLTTSVVSNGLIHRMSKDVAKSIDTITLSLDSPYRAKNDKLRWKGSYDLVMKSIKEIREHAPKKRILISMVLGRANGENLDDIKEMIKFCNENNVYLYLLPMRAESNEDAEAVAVAKEERRPNVGNKGAIERHLPFPEQLMAWEYTLQAKYNGDKIANSDLHLKRMIELSKGGRWPLQEGCNFSQGMFIIQADGAIGRCNDWGGNVGNLFDQNGQIISGGLRGLLSSPEYKAHQKIGHEGCVECTSCSWHDASRALDLNANVLLTSPIFFGAMETTQAIRRGKYKLIQGATSLFLGSGSQKNKK